jgi:hypothetical protein
MRRQESREGSSEKTSEESKTGRKDPGEKILSQEERWLRECDGRPSLEAEDALLEALKREYPEMWHALCVQALRQTSK